MNCHNGLGVVGGQGEEQGGEEKKFEKSGIAGGAESDRSERGNHHGFNSAPIAASGISTGLNGNFVAVNNDGPKTIHDMNGIANTTITGSDIRSAAVNRVLDGFPSSPLSQSQLQEVKRLKEYILQCPLGVIAPEDNNIDNNATSNGDAGANVHRNSSVPTAASPQSIATKIALDALDRAVEVSLELTKREIERGREEHIAAAILLHGAATSTRAPIPDSGLNTGVRGLAIGSNVEKRDESFHKPTSEHRKGIGSGLSSNDKLQWL